MSEQKLHPARYQFEPGEQPDDLKLVDSLNLFIDHVDALGSMLASVTNDSENLPDENTIRIVAHHMRQITGEAQCLLNQWWDGKTPQLRQVAGDES